MSAEFPAAGANAADKSKERGIEKIKKFTVFLDLFEKYIEATNKFYEIAKHQEQGAAFAVREIKSVFEDAGNPQGAEKVLTALLENTENRTIPNIIRFELLDLRKDTGQTEIDVIVKSQNRCRGRASSRFTFPGPELGNERF